MEATASLSEQAKDLLDIFAEDSDKAQGVADPKTFERFCRFAVVAHAEKAALNHETVYQYLVESEWSPEQADAAAKRYKAARLLLGMYDQFKDGTLAL